MDKARETREDVLLPTIGPAVGVNNLVEFWQRVNTALDYAEVNGHELLDGADSSDLEHVVSSTFESWTEEGGPSWAYTKGIHKGKPLGAVGLVKLADAGRKLLDLIREQLGVPLMQLPEESTLDITAFDWWGASSFAQTFFVRPARRFVRRPLTTTCSDLPRAAKWPTSSSAAARTSPSRTFGRSSSPTRPSSTTAAPSFVRTRP